MSDLSENSKKRIVFAKSSVTRMVLPFSPDLSVESIRALLQRAEWVRGFWLSRQGSDRETCPITAALEFPPWLSPEQREAFLAVREAAQSVDAKNLSPSSLSERIIVRRGYASIAGIAISEEDPLPRLKVSQKFLDRVYHQPPARRQAYAEGVILHEQGHIMTTPEGQLCLEDRGDISEVPQLLERLERQHCAALAVVKCKTGQMSGSPYSVMGWLQKGAQETDMETTLTALEAITRREFPQSLRTEFFADTHAVKNANDPGAYRDFLHHTAIEETPYDTDGNLRILTHPPTIERERIADANIRQRHTTERALAKRKTVDDPSFDPVHDIDYKTYVPPPKSKPAQRTRISSTNMPIDDITRAGADFQTRVSASKQDKSR